MTTGRMRRAAILTLLGLTAVLAFAAGCGGNGDNQGSGPKRGTFVGKVSGTNAYIALTTEGGKLGGYICDSKQVSVWLGASDLSGSSGELVSRVGKQLGEARFAEDSASGKVEIDGKTHSFRAEPASGNAGLYRGAVDGKYAVVGNLEAAWVVLPDGTQRGATTHWTDPEPIPVRQVIAAPQLPTGATSVSVAGAKLRVQPWTDPDPQP